MTDIEYIREKVDRILIQVTKTNGRVDRLENDNEDLRKDVDDLIADGNIMKGRDKTIWYVIVALATIVGFFLAHLISKI